MPNFNLDWKPHYICFLKKSSANWISDVTWIRSDDLSELPQQGGLYTIENSAGLRLYVGKADNWLNRFRGRNRVLREFRLAYAASSGHGNPVSTYIVRLAEVTPAAAIPMAEEWLIRISYLYQNAKPPLLLQNINATASLTVPASGLTITNTFNKDRPSYLEASYDYPGGDEI
jgi:hypothetical protein